VSACSTPHSAALATACIAREASGSWWRLGDVLRATMCALACTLIAPMALAQVNNDEPQSVVWMVVSYHPGMPWSDAQISGVRDQLTRQSPHTELRLDFLDTKRMAPTETYYQQMEAIALSKYQASPPHLILAADDDALDFALRMRQRHFPDAVILFSGVSSSRQASLQQERAIGGVFDDLDVADSLAQMLQMLPNTRRVVVIHDQSRTSLAQVDSVLAHAPNGAARMEFLTKLSAEAIEDHLRTLNANDLVFALPFNRDSKGRILSHEEAADLWALASNAPVAVTRDVAMRTGILGGFLVSGYDQGKTLGQLAVQVLNGTAMDTLPFVASRGHATFDDRQMRRWHMDTGRLPPDATVLNREISPLDGLRPHLPLLSVVFGSLLIIILLLLHNTRAQQRARLTLQRSARNFQTLFHSSPDGIVVRHGETGQMVQVNSRFLAMFGYSADEVSGLRAHDLSSNEPGYGKAEIQAWYRRTLENGPQTFDWRSKRKDGSVFWSELSTSTLDLGDGPCILATVRDISDRKAADLLQKAFAHDMQQVYQNLPIAVFAIDGAHKVTFWNPTMSRITGVPADDVVGTPQSWKGAYTHERPSLADALVDGATPQELMRLYDNTLQPHAVIPGALEGEAYFSALNNGNGMWIRFCAAPLIDNTGRVHGAIETLIDVTQLKRAQENLVQLNSDLEARVARRTSDLKLAMAQLLESEKMAALGSLVAGVAHELNTPIGNVLAVASTLQEDVQNFSQKLLSGEARRSDVEHSCQRLQEASTLIERNAVRAAKLINDFKEVAVDQSSTRRRSFDLRTVVEEVLATSCPLLKGTAHTVQLNIPDAITMDSFPGPLEQVLTNLLHNSVRHGFEGRDQGQITVTVQRDVEADSVVLTYEDNGCGIPPANLPHIFEPFYTTKLGQGGSGLGLYIVYNLVTHVLGGKLSAESSAPQGTRFVLRLPLTGPQRTPEEPHTPPAGG
jgi:PAS domain S-box-containing protein